VRAIAAGRITEAGDVGAIRAALTELFSAFVLRRTADAPAHVAVQPELAAGEYFLEPVVRPDAVLSSAWVIPDPADFGSPDEPLRLADALRLGVTGRIEYVGDDLPLRRIALDLGQESDGQEGTAQT